MDVDKHLKATLGWLYEVENKDGNVRNAIEILEAMVRILAFEKGAKKE